MWLLSALHREFEERSENHPLGWISLSQNPGRYVIPCALASEFRLPEAAAWAPEILTPKSCFGWSDPLPGSADFAQLLTPSKERKNALRALLAQRPEVIGYAQGLWKAWGSTSDLSVETLTHYSSYFANVQTWEPETQLPQGLQVFQSDEVLHPVESFSLRGDQLSIRFAGQPEITSRHWVFNADLRTLRHLVSKCPPFAGLLNLPREDRGLQALYPLRIVTRSEAIPAPVRQWSIAFDSALIPDARTEVWPFSMQRLENDLAELCFWVQAPAEVSLEALSDQARQALGRAYRLFPFLERAVVELPFSMGMDTCHEPQERRLASDALQKCSREIYSHTALRPDTRTACASLLTPQLGCQLPYPLGGLLEARQLLRKWLGKKRPARPENQTFVRNP